MKTIMSAKGILKTYLDGDSLLTALDYVDLTIKRGEFLMIMGPSGSGKTTLLEILGLLLTPNEGTVTFQGQDTETLSTEEKTQLRLENIGFIFQDHNLVNNLTALENVCIPLDFLGLPYGDQVSRSLEILDYFGLGDRGETQVSKLSGGQKQRIAIARAIAHHPKLVFADEPTASLDHESCLDVMKILRNHCDNHHTTIVMVSHDVRLIEYVDRLVKVEDGRIQR